MAAHIKHIKNLTDEASKLNSKSYLTFSTVSVDYKFVRFESIGYSNGGIDMPNLKISNRNKDGGWDEKPVIVIVGR